MKSTVIQIRLNDDEIKGLDKCRSGVEGGKMNRSEFMRLLLRRENLRRTTGRSKVLFNDVASDARTGRPKLTD